MEKEQLIFGFAFGLLNIDDINKKNLNDDFFIKSLKYNMDSIKRIPNQYKTEKVCKTIFELEDIFDDYLDYLPETLIKKILNDPYNYYLIKKLDDRFKTKELCEKAVKIDGGLIEYVPDKYMSKELALLAFKTNVYVIKKIGDKYKSRELCINSVKISTFRALSYVPKNIIDQEICNLAIESNIRNIEFVPKKFKTKDIIDRVIDFNGLCLKYIEKDLMNKEICEKAVMNNPLAIEYVPKKYKTCEMCYKAVLKNASVIMFIPKEFLKNIKQKLTTEYYEDYKNGISSYQDLFEVTDYIKKREESDIIRKEKRANNKSLEKKLTELF